MEAKKFIHDELSAFIERFAKTRVRYKYDPNALVHIVEVLPNEVYSLDRDYIEWENDCYNRFIAEFPTETLCFISDNAIIDIIEPELVLEGSEYEGSLSQNYDGLFVIKVSYREMPFEKVTFSECKSDNSMNKFDIPDDIPKTYFESGILNAA